MAELVHNYIDTWLCVKKGAKYCEREGNEHGHAVERTLTHTYTYGCYENKPNTIKGKTI